MLSSGVKFRPAGLAEAGRATVLPPRFVGSLVRRGPRRRQHAVARQGHAARLGGHERRQRLHLQSQFALKRVQAVAVGYQRLPISLAAALLDWLRGLLRREILQSGDFFTQAR